MEDTKYSSRLSLVYPVLEEHGNTVEDEYEKPSLETSKWAVYWDDQEHSWYYFDKIKGKPFDRYLSFIAVMFICFYVLRNFPMEEAYGIESHSIEKSRRRSF